MRNAQAIAPVNAASASLCAKVSCGSLSPGTATAVDARRGADRAQASAHEDRNLAEHVRVLEDLAVPQPVSGDEA